MESKTSYAAIMMIWSGLNLVREQMFKKMIIESDCSPLVQKLVNKSLNQSEFRYFIQSIRNELELFNNIKEAPWYKSSHLSWFKYSLMKEHILLFFFLKKNTIVV